MGIADFTGYLTAAKTVLDIFKGIRSSFHLVQTERQSTNKSRMPKLRLIPVRLN